LSRDAKSTDSFHAGPTAPDGRDGEVAGHDSIKPDGTGDGAGLPEAEDPQGKAEGSKAVSGLGSTDTGGHVDSIQMDNSSGNSKCQSPRVASVVVPQVMLTEDSHSSNKDCGETNICDKQHDDFCNSSGGSASKQTVHPVGYLHDDGAVEARAELGDDRNAGQEAQSNSPPIAIDDCANKGDLNLELKPGDLIHVGSGVSGDHKNCKAVVTAVHEVHCTAVVLDDELCLGVGEIWPNFSDVTLVSSHWRLGTEVVVVGLQNPNIQVHNGATGVIVEHAKHGHPLFMQRHDPSEKPHLTLCVKITSGGAGVKKLLLKPRFLITCDAYFASIADSLKDVVNDVETRSLSRTQALDQDTDA